MVSTGGKVCYGLGAEHEFPIGWNVSWHLGLRRVKLPSSVERKWSFWFTGEEEKGK